MAPLPQGRPQRLVYFATPEIAVAPLEALVAVGLHVALVVTGGDKRRGRGGAMTPSPVKTVAQRLAIPVSHRLCDALDVGADLGVVVAFGTLIPVRLLERLPMVNLHFSLLPRWRGAAPVERALLAGDAVTGVCLMQLEAGLDAGPILDVVEVPIGLAKTARGLRRELVEVGAKMLADNLCRGLGAGVAQAGEATYAAKLDPEELEIDWTRPVTEIDRLIRVGDAWTTFRGRRLKVLAAGLAHHEAAPGSFVAPLTVAGGDGSLVLVTVQPEAKSPMAASAWANGARPVIGERVGDRAR